MGTTTGSLSCDTACTGAISGESAVAGAGPAAAAATDSFMTAVWTGLDCPVASVAEASADDAGRSSAFFLRLKNFIIVVLEYVPTSVREGAYPTTVA